MRRCPMSSARATVSPSKSPDRPYHSLPAPVVADIIGREHFVRAYPPVEEGEVVPPDLFDGIAPEG